MSDFDKKNGPSVTALMFKAVEELVEYYEEARETGRPDAMHDALYFIEESAIATEAHSGCYCIRLSEGPSVQIVGKLSESGEPQTARIQWREQGKAWTDWETDQEIEHVLLVYAGAFPWKCD